MLQYVSFYSWSATQGKCIRDHVEGAQPSLFTEIRKKTNTMNSKRKTHPKTTKTNRTINTTEYSEASMWYQLHERSSANLDIDFHF